MNWKLTAVIVLVLVLTPFAPGFAADEEYRIGVDDVLHVVVWDNKELEQTVVVRPDGRISYPLAGELRVQGLTVSEVVAQSEKISLRMAPAPDQTVHMTMAEKEFGVLYTLCFMCGGDTVRTNESTIKCVECGAFENRKLAHDYGKETARLIYKAGR